jgi:F420-0:gamma-glutamyl ligase-like protein
MYVKVNNKTQYFVTLKTTVSVSKRANQGEFVQENAYLPGILVPYNVDTWFHRMYAFYAVFVKDFYKYTVGN